MCRKESLQYVMMITLVTFGVNATKRGRDKLSSSSTTTSTVWTEHTVYSTHWDIQQYRMYHNRIVSISSDRLKSLEYKTHTPLRKDLSNIVIIFVFKQNYLWSPKIVNLPFSSIYILQGAESNLANCFFCFCFTMHVCT